MYVIFISCVALYFEMCTLVGFFYLKVSMINLSTKSLMYSDGGSRTVLSVSAGSGTGGHVLWTAKAHLHRPSDTIPSPNPNSARIITALGPLCDPLRLLYHPSLKDTDLEQEPSCWSYELLGYVAVYFWSDECLFLRNLFRNLSSIIVHTVIVLYCTVVRLWKPYGAKK